MRLSKQILPQLNNRQLMVPADSLWTLPEKVLQFGTGVLLRGLPDYFIDKANKQGIFNGRVVVVKSTSNGGTDAYREQDGLYTLLERGVENGALSDKATINAAISRVLSANEEWEEIERCAASPHMKVIISNTTEVGIVLVETDAHTAQPISFPGRLLLFLQARYNAFEGSIESGMVIIPTELIVDNGVQLKNIVTALARLKGLDDAFLNWLETANDFCNSLVDRIVPGKLSGRTLALAEEELGYTDELMIMSEPYRLWAIETKEERTKSILSFSRADDGIVIAPDINKFRELKLRLLNASHTLSCGLAHLAGFVTVKDAMNDELFADFISGLMVQEIVPLVTQNDITTAEAVRFVAQVIDRFKNPYIDHQWLSITVQYTSKMEMRTVPLLEKYYACNNEAPRLMALGYAAFILFMHPVKKDGEVYYGACGGSLYRIQDDRAALLYAGWQEGSLYKVIEKILQDTAIFGKDLTQYKGFADAVHIYLISLMEQGIGKTLHTGVINKSVA